MIVLKTHYAKKTIFIVIFSNNCIQYWIDSNNRQEPKMISDQQFRQGMKRTVHRPFRVVPFFDPAPWGGQCMKEVCDLPREEANYGWCFDCVPEENSLYLNVDGVLVEFPAQDVVLSLSHELLGEQVWLVLARNFPYVSISLIPWGAATSVCKFILPTSLHTASSES